MSIINNIIESELDNLDGNLISSKHHPEIVEHRNFYDNMLIRDFGYDYLNKIREDIKLNKKR